MSDWIDIVHITPPRDEQVLLRLKEGRTLIGRRTGDAGRIAYEYVNVSGVEDGQPTHWMFLRPALFESPSPETTQTVYEPAGHPAERPTMATILDMLRLAESNLANLPKPQGFGPRTSFALATLRLRNAICLLEKGYPIGANADTLLDLTPVEEVPNYQPPASTANLADLAHRVATLESAINRLEAYAASLPVLCAQWQAPDIAGLERRLWAVEQRDWPQDITVGTTVPQAEPITRDQSATGTTSPTAATPAHDPSPSAAAPA